MSDEINDLIAETRSRHKGAGLSDRFKFCWHCEDEWPCDASRLADALEAATDGRLTQAELEDIAETHAFCADRLFIETELVDEIRAERDAALAAVERIRQAVSGHPECGRYEEDDVISCGWKSAYASVLAALDGAHEPEVKP